MTVTSTLENLTLSEIGRLCHAGLESETLSSRVAERLRRAVPFDGYAVVTMDPLTGLATNFYFSEEMGNEEDASFFLENIYFEDDVLDYGWMVRNHIPAMTLSEATGGRLERALRYREYNAPRGFGPGVRAVLTANEQLWGGLCLVRGTDVPDFDERELDVLRRISPHLGAGLRAASLLGSTREPANGSDAEFQHDDGEPKVIAAPDAAGVLGLDRWGRVSWRTGPAEHWMRELGAPENGRPDDIAPPRPVCAVVGALRRSLAPRTGKDSALVPSIRVRGRSGQWLTLQASLSEPMNGGPAETVVVIAPAAPREVALLRATAHGLSAREKEIAGFVLRGFSTRQISGLLYISESTVQGHLSHVFEKVGVHSRRELVKRLFLDNISSRTPA